MSKLARVGRYWNRLCSLSMVDIVHRAGTGATQAVGRRRVSGPVPVAQPGMPGVAWLPVGETLSNAWARQRADEVLAGYWRVLARGRVKLGFPPEWNRNPANGALLPPTNGKIMSVRETGEAGDISYLWALNRHLELVCLAQAWRETGQRRYLDGIGRLLDGWIDQCPPMCGPNWSSALEASVRLINWATVWQLIGGAESPLFESPVGLVLMNAWLESIWRHAEFIRGHRSRHPSANGNLIGELAGLFVAGVTWPCWDQSSLWRRDAREGLEAEVLVQIAPDGVDREQATGYQQFVWDCLLFAGLAARASGEPFSMAYWKRMEAMQEYLAAIMDAGGHVPMFGDADDAQVSGLSLGAGGDVHQSQLATAALLFHHAGLARKAGIVDTRTRWLLGETMCGGFDDLLLKSAPATGRTDFPDGGTYVLGANLDSADEFRVVADAGPLGRDGIAAHGHADALSFTLSVSGREFLIDPGTGTCHGSRAWREALRGTAMHNTMTILNQDQAVSGGKFIWRRKYAVRVLERDSNRVVDHLVAEHDGYRRLAGRPVHRRSWRLDRQQASLTVVDEVIASTSQTVSLNWHFSEECHVTCTPEGVLVANGPVCLRMTLPPDGEVSILRGSEEPMAGWVSRRYDSMEPTTTLMWRGRINPGETLETVFKRV